MSQARLIVGSIACGCPFIGLGAEPPLLMFVQLNCPPLPPTAVNVPLIFWLHTPSVSRMTVLRAPFRPVYGPVQLNWLYDSISPMDGLVPPSAFVMSAW